jgi:hypothetical protein
LNVCIGDDDEALGEDHIVQYLKLPRFYTLLSNSPLIKKMKLKMYAENFPAMPLPVPALEEVLVKFYHYERDDHLVEPFLKNLLSLKTLKKMELVFDMDDDDEEQVIQWDEMGKALNIFVKENSPHVELGVSRK